MGQRRLFLQDKLCPLESKLPDHQFATNMSHGPSSEGVLEGGGRRKWGDRERYLVSLVIDTTCQI